MKIRKTPAPPERKHAKAKPPPAQEAAAVDEARALLEKELETQAASANHAYWSARHDPAAFAALRQAVQAYCDGTGKTFLPQGWDIWQWLEVGSPSDLETPVAYLEADLWYSGSGYMKSSVIRRLTRQPIPETYARRLRRVVLALVDTRNTREFHTYRRLARHVDAPELRREIESRLNHTDPAVRQRARWVLEALERR